MLIDETMPAAAPGSMRDFLREHNIHEVECVIADMTGIARGKILPKDLFLAGELMRLPKSVLLNTVHGEQPNNTPYVGATDPDMICVPDSSTMRVVPWATERVALVIHDCQDFDGKPVDLAPRAALRHGIFATFMAKPMETEPGSAMHVHQSIVDGAGRNIFSDADGRESRPFRHFIGGLARYVPPATLLFAPHVNSYRRLSRYQSAPMNVHWGYDNRTCGIRVPNSGPANRRVENRVPGVDVNPYLAMAATLACGYLGMVEGIEPAAPTGESAEHVHGELPRNLEDAIQQLRNCPALADMLGPRFVQAFCEVKELEFATFSRVISSWEREHLMLLV